MKLVALTQRLVEQKDYGEVRDALDVRWAVLCRALGVIPVPLATTMDVAAVFKKLPIGGIILTGGNDLSSFADNPLSRQRDAFETKVVNAGLRKKIPILGVCRGMQFLAERFGVPCERLDGHAGSRHGLAISPKSRFSPWLKEMKDVNSFHNFGIKKAPKGFLASATSADGVVEAMENAGKKIFAQMWHPEREDPFFPAQIKLLKRFLGS